jgi:S1-C subfamily serine protease
MILVLASLTTLSAKRRAGDTTYCWTDNTDAIGRIISLDSSRFLGAGFYVAPYGVVISASHVSHRDTTLFEHILSRQRDTLVAVHRILHRDLVVYSAIHRNAGPDESFQLGGSPSILDSVIYLGLREDGVLYRFNSHISAIGDYALPGDSVPVRAIAIDANIMGGMSGGPVLDTAGYVIGVLIGRLIHTPEGGRDSTAVLAMPTDTLRQLLEVTQQAEKTVGR